MPRRTYSERGGLPHFSPKRGFCFVPHQPSNDKPNRHTRLRIPVKKTLLAGSQTFRPGHLPPRRKAGKCSSRKVPAKAYGALSNRGRGDGGPCVKGRQSKAYKPCPGVAWVRGGATPHLAQITRISRNYHWYYCMH